MLSPNTPSSTVDDTAISDDSGANPPDSVIISPELNDNLAEGSSPLIAENILADGSVLYTGHSLAAGQRLIVDKDITDIAKPWDYNPGEQYVIGILRENASAPYDIDDFEYAVIYEAIEANTDGYKHEIRASAPDSDANIKLPSATNDAISYAAMEVRQDGEAVWLILDSSANDIEFKVARNIEGEAINSFTIIEAEKMNLMAQILERFT